MLASIITIGDEILIGQTIDTNSAWLGRELNEIGVEVLQIHSISDQEKEIKRAIDESFALVDLLIVTGGLGPTNDDITKKTLVDYFNGKLELDQDVLERIEHFFKLRNLSILDVHRQQAMLPNNAQKLINNFGSASGMWFEKDNKILISLPGVPYEMKGILREFGFPKIQSQFKLAHIYHRTILTWGRGESFIADKIEKWEAECRKLGLGIAYLPSPGLVKIRISGKEDEISVRKRVDEKASELYSLIPNYIYGENDEKLEERAGKVLSEKQLSIATAESCTGGYLAHLLTSIPGSSSYFRGSIIAYTNEVKINLLNVLESDLNQYGAVSETVAKQMAMNVREKFSSDIGIATTGIAGPDGGTEAIPVGTIWIAIASQEGVYTKQLRLGTRRLNNIKICAIVCLGRLLKEIH